MTQPIKVEWVNGVAPSDDENVIKGLIEEQLLFEPTTDDNCYDVVYQGKTFRALLHTGDTQ